MSAVVVDEDNDVFAVRLRQAARLSRAGDGAVSGSPPATHPPCLGEPIDLPVIKRLDKGVKNPNRERESVLPFLRRAFQLVFSRGKPRQDSVRRALCNVLLACLGGKLFHYPQAFIYVAVLFL